MVSFVHLAKQRKIQTVTVDYVEIQNISESSNTLFLTRRIKYPSHIHRKKITVKQALSSSQQKNQQIIFCFTESFRIFIFRFLSVVFKLLLFSDFWAECKVWSGSVSSFLFFNTVLVTMYPMGKQYHYNLYALGARLYPIILQNYDSSSQ